MNVNPTEVKSVLNSLLSIYMQDRERKLNDTNPSLVQQEEISASLYILIIIGFFGFLLFSMMLSNIVLRQRENYMDHLFQNKFPRNRRTTSCNSIMVNVGMGIAAEANIGETDLSESLITGDKFPSEDNLNWPVWTVVHAGNSQGWVPWRYRVFLRDDLPLGQQEDMFQEFCDFLSITYGKCAIVVKEKKRSRMKTEASNQEVDRTDPQAISHPYLLNIKRCPEIAKTTGHEFLSVPFDYNYLHPMDAVWSSLKWFIINNRKEFSLTSLERTYSYQCILLSDLIGKGIEKTSPNKWKVAVNKVRRWENYYLDKFS